jgi:Fe-S-cluster formation regulator IscX/YfhJ
VPAELARELDAGEWQAVSLREFSEDERRTGLRVLLAPRDAWIGKPRS